MVTLMDLHIHSSYSRHWWAGQSSLATPKEILDAAEERNIKVIAIADHNSIEGAKEAVKLARDRDIIVLPAVELSTIDGHLLGFNATEPVPKWLTAEAAIDKLREQGAFVVAAHPMFVIASIGLKARKLKLDALEGFNARCAVSNSSSQRLAKRLNLPVTGGSDAHSLDEIGNGLCITAKEVYTVEDVLRAIKHHKVILSGNPAKAYQIVKNSMQIMASKVRRESQFIKHKI